MSDDVSHPRPVPEVGDLTYEQARDQLIEVVRALEEGGVPLEDSLVLWERGEALAKVCEQRLEGARRRIDEALATANGDDADADPAAS